MILYYYITSACFVTSVNSQWNRWKPYRVFFSGVGVLFCTAFLLFALLRPCLATFSDVIQRQLDVDAELVDYPRLL